MSQRLYSAKEVSEEFRLPLSYVYRETKSGTYPSQTSKGGYLRIPRKVAEQMKQDYLKREKSQRRFNKFGALRLKPGGRRATPPSKEQ